MACTNAIILLRLSAFDLQIRSRSGHCEVAIQKPSNCHVPPILSTMGSGSYVPEPAELFEHGESRRVQVS